jgi:Trk-type K+ transport system membrane component
LFTSFITKSRATLIPLIDGVFVVFGLACFGVFFTSVFFPHSEAVEGIYQVVARWSVMIFLVGQGARWALALNKAAYFKARKLDVVGAMVMLVLLLIPPSLLMRVFESDALRPEKVSLTLLGLSALGLVTVKSLRWVKKKRLFKNITLSPQQLFIVSFAVPIALGTLLLSLPNSTHSEVSFIDILFVSTSAMCVTGLSTVDVLGTFTFVGQMVILCLFQIGALGVMTITMSIAALATGRISIGDRLIASKLFDSEHSEELKSILKRVGFLAFGFESVGAVLLLLDRLHSGAAFSLHLVYESIFHAVSAFCNAGFSLFPQSFATDGLQVSAFHLSVIMVLIVLGGLGFPVLSELNGARHSFKSRKSSRLHLSVHSRIVLVTSGLLILAGAAVVYLFEPSYSLMESVFLSVTARTAGFNLTDTGSLGIPVSILITGLMWIGAAPASTGGGIKCTTFAIACIQFVNQIRQRKRCVIWGREIEESTIARAFSAIFASLFLLFVATIALIFLNPHLYYFDVAFEAFSAWGTVGLSRGATGQLSESSKLIVILLMFVGRVGILNFFTSIIPSVKPERYRYLKDRIIVY